MKKELIVIAGAIAVLLIIFGAVIFYKQKPFEEEKMNQVTPTANEANDTNPNTQPTMSVKVLPSPALTIDESKSYTAVMKTTEGEIDISLDVKNTPITANNFIYLANNHFYDNTIFHRVIKDFMIQGGDPNGDGTGGPGYQLNDEPFIGEYDRGVIAMANAGPNTNGSQFFIMHKNYPLPKNYVIFGKVVKGIEVVDKIAESPTEANIMGEKSQPVNPVEIESVFIEEK